jgi:hypothetical protein
MKILFYVTLSVILAYSIISMAKPGFYLLSLNTPQQFVLELGPPVSERTSERAPDYALEYLYRAGMIKPFCIDYVMTFVKGVVTKWTWHTCTMAPPALPPPALSETLFRPTGASELS